MIVILSYTKYVSNTIFTDDKIDTLKVLKDLLIRKIQWTDYIEEVLHLITINNGSEVYETCSFMQQILLYCICNISLLQCNKGYVYVLLSMKDKNFMYTGTKK